MDQYLFNLINQFAGRSVILDRIAVFFAEYFEYVLMLLLLIIFWKKPRTIIQAFLSAILARFGVVELIRYLLPRARPFVENNVNLLVSHEASSSFPSGHAAFYFALATIVYFYNKKAGIVFFISAFLISLARVFSGIHWPSDILAGAIVGIFSGWLVVKLSRRR